MSLFFNVSEILSVISKNLNRHVTLKTPHTGIIYHACTGTRCKTNGMDNYTAPLNWSVYSERFLAEFQLNRYYAAQQTVGRWVSGHMSHVLDWSHGSWVGAC